MSETTLELLGRMHLDAIRDGDWETAERLTTTILSAQLRGDEPA